MDASTLTGNPVSSQEAVLAPGDFFIEPMSAEAKEFWMLSGDYHILWCILPGGKSAHDWFLGNEFKPNSARLNRPSWQWDGNKQSPTLNPSLHHIDHWHGWLRNGKFVSC